MPQRPTPADAPDANLSPCQVGVVYALAIEAVALERQLKGLIAIQSHQFNAKQGGLNGRGVAVVSAGVGRERAGRATERLILGHRPRLVVSAGLAGGLHPDLKIGDVFVADAIVGESGRRLLVDLSPFNASRAAGVANVRVGPLVTIDRVALKSAHKRQLAEDHRAMAVDMETLGVADVCQREGQRFIAIRVISDAAGDELPADLERLMTRKTLARQIGAAAGTFLRRPSVVKELWHYRETAIVCSQKLAKFLAEFISGVDGG